MSNTAPTPAANSNLKDHLWMAADTLRHLAWFAQTAGFKPAQFEGDYAQSLYEIADDIEALG